MPGIQQPPAIYALHKHFQCLTALKQRGTAQREAMGGYSFERERLLPKICTGHLAQHTKLKHTARGSLRGSVTNVQGQ